MKSLALLRPTGRKNVRPRMNWELPTGDERSPRSTPAGGAPGHRRGLLPPQVASSRAHVASVLLASPGGLLRLPRSTPQLGRSSSARRSMNGLVLLRPVRTSAGEAHRRGHGVACASGNALETRNPFILKLPSDSLTALVTIQDNMCIAMCYYV
jgi:hypothetical protein